MIWFLVLLGFILPIILIIIGLTFSKHAPKKINSFSGYRTERSMKNIETWKEANKYSAKLLLKYAIYLLSLITISLIFTFKSCALMAMVDILSILLGIGLVFAVIIKTENHLKKVFG